MNKYIIIMLSLNIPLHCMEPQQKQITQRSPREWPAAQYDKDSKIQTDAFLQFLEHCKISTQNRTILEVGCGTGELAARLAKIAKNIHGFDASNNMITFAQNKHSNINNISFERCFAEDFISQEKYQLALAPFCIHWFEDKKQAFQRINDALEINGELFGTFQCSDNETPFNLVAARELINKYFAWLEKLGVNLTGSTYPSANEYHTMLCESGFEIVGSEEQSFSGEINKKDLEKRLSSLALTTPLAQYIPDIIINPLLDEYLELCLSKLSKTDDSNFFYKIVTTVIHARKRTNK